MDFLDPKKERMMHTRLLIGYGLVALAIGIATLVLLYQAYGYGIDRQGNVTQNGLLFVSSQPAGATITLNGKPYKSNTNTRVVVPADTYTLQVSEAGYRTWQRQVVVSGGDVQHFDYPFLFPQTLQTTSLGDLAADPSVALQSPDKRWLLVGQSESSGSFIQYDLKNPAQPAATQISLPPDMFTTGDSDGAQSWSLVEWASDNRHALVLHTYTVKGTTDREYILLDRDTPADSVNITNNLSLSQTETVNLFDSKIDQYYVYDSGNQTLQRVNADDGSVVSSLSHILAFKPYASDQLLYVTTQPPSGITTKSDVVTAVFQDGQKTIGLRTLPAGASSYDLNLAQYSGSWYVAVGATNDSAAYIYRDPQSQTVGADGFPAPWRRLPVSDPSFLSFSGNAQFLLAENGQDFVVYDLENVVQYHYHASAPIDQPQLHATWMDGDRLLYVSGGKLVVFDYDYRNLQTLVPANPVYPVFFSSDFSYLYALRAGSADGSAKPALTSTGLVIKH
ncbi:MAG: PEGA domain-containing protein [Candidatus Saccharibacteria bacterium]